MNNLLNSVIPSWSVLVIGVFAILFSRGELSAQTEQQIVELLEAQPYDELNVRNEEKPVKLVPLELTPRKPIDQAKEKPNDKLYVKLLGRPDRKYQIAWSDVDSVKLFEEQFLAMAQTLTEKERFDDAHRLIQYMDKHFPKFPGVQLKYNQCLFAEAQFWARKKRFDQAYSLLCEVHRRKPDYGTLSRAFDVVVDQLVGQHIKDKKRVASRMILEGLEKRFPESEIILKRRAEIQKLAESEIKKAKEFLAANEVRNAFQFANSGTKWWPAIEGGRETIEKIRQDYPILFVGVTRLNSISDQPNIDWVYARQSQLLQASLVRATSYSSSGKPTLKFAEGVQQSASENEMSITIDPVLSPFRTEEVYVAQVVWNSQNGLAPLSQTTKLGPPTASKTRSILFPKTEPNRLKYLLLAQRHCGSPDQKFVPFQSSERTSEEHVFTLNKEYVLRNEFPVQLIEQKISSSGRAIRALKNGDVQAIDLVEPWELSKFSNQSGIQLSQYAAPTVSFLIANPNSTALQSAESRRAVSQGIHRDLIVQNHFAVGEKLANPLVSSSFLPAGTTSTAKNKPAYRPTDMVAYLSSRPTNSKIVISHFPNARAKRACADIASQLRLGGKGFQVQLEVLDKNSAQQNNWDLLYVDWHFQDPELDCYSLFGNEGVALSNCPLMQHLIGQLHAAKTDADRVKQLQKIEQRVTQNYSIIPLWQIKEHYAVRTSLNLATKSRTHFYQDLQQWGTR